ncbi:MAG TPA: amidohydrolase family protein [Devosia sp.]|nr:amidohydrolase family protein [Devosia sp.]
MSKRRIIDAHHHLWDLDHGYAYPWLQDKAEGEGMLGDLALIAKTYLPADYRAESSVYDLVKSVHIEAVPLDAVAETRWLTGLGDSLPTAIVGRTVLNAPDTEEIIATHAALPRVKGIRHIVNWHANPRYTFTPADLLEDAAWQRGFALLRKYGLSFDMQLYPGQMQGALQLAQRHPDTLIVINHAGMPVDRDEAGIRLWRDGLKALAAADNVAIKISGLGMVDHAWSRESIRPFVLGSIEAFGTKRAMFGSNFPVDRLYGSFSDTYAAFEHIVSDFSEAEQDRLFRATAENWYRI